MSMKLQTAIKGSVIALVMLMVTGCAAELQNQMDEMNTRVTNLESNVASAQSAADAAGASAAECPYRRRWRRRLRRPGG